MTITEDAVTFDRPAPPRQTRRRRWPWIVAGAVVLAVLACAAGFLIWAAHYQPIQLGGGSSEWPAQEITPPGHVQTQYSHDVASYGSTFLVYPHKAGYQFGFRDELWNRGRYAVKILGVGGPSNSPLLSDPHDKAFPAHAVMLLPGDAWSPRPIRPFKPFTLASDQMEAQVGLTWTYQGCPAGMRVSTTALGAGANFMTTFTVKYKFLWFTHTATLPMRDWLGLVDVPVCERTPRAGS